VGSRYPVRMLTPRTTTSADVLHVTGWEADADTAMWLRARGLYESEGEVGAGPAGTCGYQSAQPLSILGANAQFDRQVPG
jgi:hypothetical protein